MDGHFFGRVLRNSILLAAFFILTPLTISISAFSLGVLTNYSEPIPAKESILSKSVISSPQTGVQVYAALPENIASLGGFATSSDARGELLRQYLSRYESPLVAYADYIVQKSDEYGIDFRLPVAIARQESALCKFIPQSTYNCWGWGIHSKGTLGFETWEAGIETVIKGLKEDYINRGLETPEEIMTKYTPLSSGSWAEAVNFFISEME